MGKSTVRVLVVDDYGPWRNFATKTLQKPGLQVVSEASDGLEAVHKAQGLQPNLILLDIGLPTINGIEAARRILQHAPKTRILFVSEQRSPDIVKEALRTGACGYVIKSQAATELLAAVEAVIQGKQFVSASLAGSAFGDPKNGRPTHHRRRDKISLTPLPNPDTARCHEVGFYSDDYRLLDDGTQFISSALKAGNAAVVVATESHRNSLLRRLQVQGVNIGTAIEQRRYIALDATDALSTFMVDEAPDPARFMETFGNLIATAGKAAIGEHRRVAVFGECVQLLWARGNAEAAIQMEKLGNLLIQAHEVDILCGYSVGGVLGDMDSHIFEQICAEHSAVHSAQ